MKEKKPKRISKLIRQKIKQKSERLTHQEYNRFTNFLNKKEPKKKIVGTIERMTSIEQIEREEKNRKFPKIKIMGGFSKL